LIHAHGEILRTVGVVLGDCAIVVDENGEPVVQDVGGVVGFVEFFHKLKEPVELHRVVF